MAQLAVLALIDSTSIGTLVIPVWLLLRSGRRGREDRVAGGGTRIAGKVAVYLGAVGVFYFLIGLVLLSGAAGVVGALGSDVGTLTDLPAVQWAMLLSGGSMLAWALMSDSSSRRSTRSPARTADSQPGAPAGIRPPAGDRPSAGEQQGPGPTVGGNWEAGTEDLRLRDGRSTAAFSGNVNNPGARIHDSGGQATGPAAGLTDAEVPEVERKWSARIGRALDSRTGLLGLALVAGLLELPTMLPYLGAVGLLTASDTAWSLSVGVLGLYCLVMLLPAALLLAGRLLLGRLLDSPLQRLGAWLSRVASEAAGWIIGIVGFFLLRAGLAALFPDASWNPFGS